MQTDPSTATDRRIRIPGRLLPQATEPMRPRSRLWGSGQRSPPPRGPEREWRGAGQRLECLGIEMRQGLCSQQPCQVKSEAEHVPYPQQPRQTRNPRDQSPRRDPPVAVALGGPMPLVIGHEYAEQHHADQRAPDESSEIGYRLAARRLPAWHELSTRIEQRRGYQQHQQRAREEQRGRTAGESGALRPGGSGCSWRRTVASRRRCSDASRRRTVPSGLSGRLRASRGPPIASAPRRRRMPRLALPPWGPVARR